LNKWFCRVEEQKPESVVLAVEYLDWMSSKKGPAIDYLVLMRFCQAALFMSHADCHERLGPGGGGPGCMRGSGGWESRRVQGGGAVGCGLLAALWQFGKPPVASLSKVPAHPIQNWDQCRAETFFSFPPHRAATMLNFKI
jgi:hypothetical protein